MKSTHLLLAVGMVVLVGASAYATSLSGSAVVGTDLTASATLTYGSGSFSGSLTFTNSNPTSDAGIIAWSLQLFGGGTSITGLTMTVPGGWEYYKNDKQSNNGTACSSNTNNGWICADGFTSGGLPFTLAVIPEKVGPTDGSITFTFSGTYSGSSFIPELDLMANGCLTTGYTTQTSNKGVVSVNCNDLPNGGSGKWAYSDVLPSTQTPEPGSFVLLGAGMLGLFGMRRVRK